MLLDLRRPPQRGKTALLARVQTLRQQQRKRPEYEGVLEDFRARQDQTIEITDLIAIQQHIDIQRQALALGGITAVVRLDEFQPAVQLAQRQVAVAGHHQVEEGSTLDPHRLTFEHRRTAHVAQHGGQRIEPGLQMRLSLDIAAQPEHNGS
ncbi:hypothetical protein D3C86_1527800 [compost metagenome]